MRYSVRSALVVGLVWITLVVLALPSEGRDGVPEDKLTGMTETVFAPTESTHLSVPAPASFDNTLCLSIQTADGVQVMDLHSYLTGVLLAEMPVSFADEALKAQAVACRTYALTRCQSPRHSEAALCTDSHCCQAWTDPECVEPKARARADAAVRATDGLVLVYEGALIDATFFSCSGGRTEDAAAVWGSEFAYLQSVESPGEEDAAHFYDEQHVPLEEFCAKLRELDEQVSFSGEPEAWVHSVQYTAGGGVAYLELGGCFFRGTELRKAFRLRSTAFTLELNAEEAVFTTRGNGHRVGLSQYGADAMARAGNDFESILKWYYQGVSLARAEEFVE